MSRLLWLKGWSLLTEPSYCPELKHEANNKIQKLHAIFYIQSQSVTDKGPDIWKLIGLEAVAPPLWHEDGKAPGEGVEPSQAAKIKTPCLWRMGLTSLTGVIHPGWVSSIDRTHPPPHHTSSTHPGHCSPTTASSTHVTVLRRWPSVWILHHYSLLLLIWSVLYSCSSVLQSVIFSSEV